jgi:hypothetical protein
MQPITPQGFSEIFYIFVSASCLVRRRDLTYGLGMTAVTSSDLQPAPRLTITLMSDLSYGLGMHAEAETDWPAPRPRLTQTARPRPTDCPRRCLTLSPFPPNKTRLIYHIHLIFFFKFQENLYRIYRVFGVEIGSVTA